MLRYRHKLVRFRTSVMNQLHGLAIGEGLCRKSKLWSRVGRRELEVLTLDLWASRRRQELLQLVQLVDQLTPWTVRLMKQPGVGPVTALAFVLRIGPVDRFERSKQVVSYLGLNPSEESSGGKQRLGSISFR